MTIFFLSNYFDHHAKPLSDALDKLTGGGYRFLGSQKMTDERIALGWGNIDIPSYVNYVNMEKPENIRYWQQEIANADIVIQGSSPFELLSSRNKTDKITFYYAERLYKERVSYRKVYERIVKDWLMSRRPTPTTYMLSASAYNPYDFSLLGYFRNKTYRWGYFTECKHYNLDGLFTQKKESRIIEPLGVSILWAGRLIGWKHPEKAIVVAERLAKEGIPFHMNIIGCGAMEEQLMQAISEKELNEKVTMLGSMSPKNVRKHMENSDIFLFTSDRNEGWGAVLNESLNSACAVVACKDIGSVPYLINDGINGMVYRDDDIDEFYVKVRKLACNPSECRRLGVAGYETIVNTWNAENAAENLLQLYSNLKEGKDTPVLDGPCSKAPIINN